MALSFYLNQIDAQHKINVQCNASFTSKVGDFDVGTLELEWSRTKNKIAPYTKLFIVDSTLNDTWCFVVLNDDVEVIRKTPPVLYLHNLTVIQNTYELSTHLVRNSVFSQPIAPRKTKLKATGLTIVAATEYHGGYHFNEYDDIIYFPYDENDGKYVYYYEKTNVPHREKVKRAYIEINTSSESFERCTVVYNSSTATDFITQHQQGSVRQQKYNFFSSIRLIVNKYSGNTLIDTLEVNLQNGQPWIELDASFFSNNNYSYELKIDTSKNSYLNHLEQDDQFLRCFPEGETPGEGETWNIPGIQTTLDATLVLETCYYSLADVLSILNIQCTKIYNGAASIPNIYTLQSDDVLENTVAPNLTFTSSNLWECVNETLSYIDAIATLDEDGHLEYEYLNDYSREGVNLKLTDEKSSLSNEYYTNSLVANYQNARQENSIIYPGKGLFKRTSTKNYGVPGKDDYEMRVDQPIDFINNVYLWVKSDQLSDFEVIFMVDNDVPLYKFSANLGTITFRGKLPNDGVLDIGDAVYEQSIYALLPMANENDPTPNQLNTLYYVRNSKSIYLGGVRDGQDNMQYEVYKAAINLVVRNIFGITTATSSFATYMNLSIPDVEDLKYCIKYHAVFDGRVSQESVNGKHPGETYAAQEQGGANLNRMGNNMQGLIARLGNEVENVSIAVTDYGSRIKKGSLWVDDDGKKYIANSVKTTFSTKSSKVMVEAQFSRNFNLISQYTKIDQEKRFYEISDKLISKGYENIVEYLYFSFSDRNISNATAFNYEALTLVLRRNFMGTEKRKADFATFDSYDRGIDSTPQVKDIYLPMHVYGSGNSICFEMGFESAINAEDRLVNRDGALLNETCLYTGSDGFADKVNVKIYSRDDEEAVYIGDQFPQMLLDVEAPLLPAFDTIKIVDIQNFYYYKKPNEIFHLNYSLAFLPYPGEEIFFGDYLINRNAIIREMLDTNPTHVFYLYAGDEEYSIKDTKVLDTHENYGVVVVGYNTVGSRGWIEFMLSEGSITSAKAWAIADGDGNIYFAANEKLTNRNTVRLYFALRRGRVD